jgi:heat shock protein HslJ
VPTTHAPRPRSLAIGLALLTVLGSLAACSAAATQQLADRAFLSVAVTDGGAAKALVAGTRIRIGFQDGNLSASAGCNTMGGPFRIEGGVLVTDSLATTEMGCDAERHAQDQWLAELLGSRPKVRVAGDELTLEGGAIIVRLIDRKVVEPDVAIVGPTWIAVSIISGDSVSSIPAGVTASVAFNANGTISVNAGCNQGGGSWKPVAGGIELSGLGMTKKACDGAAGQLESAVMAVLGAGTMSAAIDGTMLTLQAGARGLQLRAG